MNLADFDERHVRIKDIYGNTFLGLARYADCEFLECEYGIDEDGIFIEDYLICNSQIDSIEEAEVHGTVDMLTDSLLLRRYRREDAMQLYEKMGTDPEMYKYSGWNPYATPEMAKETVRGFIESYGDVHSYSWVMDHDDIVTGTIGAYDYKNDSIEIGFSVIPGWQGRGFATEALKKVLDYLTVNESISCVTAWCAVENAASRHVLEKSGMQLIRIEKDGLKIKDRVFDKLIYEYRKRATG